MPVLARSLALPVVLLLALGGCSSKDGSSEDAKPYVDAMASSMAEGEDSPIDDKQARCISEGLVDVVGIDQIKKAGTPEEFAEGGDNLDFKDLELTHDQGKEIYGNFDECGVDLRAEMMAGLEEGEELDEDTRACLDSAITDERLEAFFVAIMVEGEDAAESGEAGKGLTGAVMECMFAGMGDPGEGPTE